MKLIRLTNTTDNYFQKAWKLYEEAFPIEERRVLEHQSYVLKNNNYHFDIIIDNNQFIGFLLWWDFGIYKYIEHFTTVAEQRNKGLGKTILNEFIARNDEPIILEVELPKSHINKRRITFYERLGFKLNLQYYEMPPLRDSQTPLHLLLMSYPNKMSEKDVDVFIKKFHTTILRKGL